jgi:CelD/BcsL family acetyltransferase involved in cellulose biosynthesis
MNKIEIVTEKKDFYNLREEWNSLLEQSSGKSIYLTWEWLYTWWETFHDNRELFILTIRDNGVLVGIAPLLVRQFKYFKFLPFKRVEFLGTGEDEKDEVCSNYLDFIVSKERADIYAVIFEYLVRKLSSGIWDELVLKTMPETSATLNTISEYFSRNKEVAAQVKYEIVNHSECAVINLPENWDTYLSSISKSWRNQINRGRKEILSKGTVDCELITESDKLSLAFDEFISLHQKRWQDVGKPGIFSSKKFTDFHKKVLGLFADKKWVRVRLLKCNGKTVAASYTFNFNKTIYFYSPAYDRDFKTKIGIGLIERSYDIEDAIKYGCIYYDFYKAKEGGYKWHLAKDKKNVHDIYVFRKGVKYYLLTSIKHFKLLLKTIKTLCRGNRQV